jgi:Fe-S-cluster-containing dehydrogenase component
MVVACDFCSRFAKGYPSICVTNCPQPTFLRGLTITEQQTIEKSVCTGVFATSRDGKISNIQTMLTAC